MYVEAELKEGNQKEAESIFRESLANVADVGLWRVYLSFVHKKQDTQTEEGRREVKTAFEFVLENVGLDVESAAVWKEYIQFLKDLVPTSQQEEGEKIVSLRKAFQKVVTRPVMGLEGLWKEYESWETELNKVAAKKIIKNFTSQYIKARSVLNEIKNLSDDIKKTFLSRPPRNQPKDVQQVKKKLSYF